MAITLVEQHQLAGDGNFVNRARQAACTVALEVLNENPTDMVNGEYDARLALARRVINDPQGMAQRFVYTLATASPTVDPAVITDPAYLTFMRNSWNALAGFNTLYPVT